MGVRFICDCSRFQGFLVNDYVFNKEKYKYSFVDLVFICKLVYKGYYMVKVEFKSVYCSVFIINRYFQIL